MIVHAAHLNGGHSMSPRNAAYISPDTFLDLGPYPFKSIFGAENNVVVTMRICVCHEVRAVADATQNSYISGSVG
jgi:hypothetical protein